MFNMEKYNSNPKTEIMAGLTTFMTMSYIVALNPNILTGFGANGGQELWNAVFMATCLASAIGTIVMAFYADKPFVMAPGMGLNSCFAVVVANIAVLTGMSYTDSFQSALCIILIEGVLFIILSLIRVREKIVEAIPLGIRMGIGPAIGLMLMNIGFGSNAGIFTDDGEYYVMRDFFGAMTPKIIADKLGGSYSQMVMYVVTMFIGLFVIILLDLRGKKSAVLVGMITASIIYWLGELIILDNNPFAGLKTAHWAPPFKDMAQLTLFKFDFKDFFSIGIFTAVTLIITFCMIDMFDTIGTLVGAASRANMLDKEGRMPKMKEALTSDAIGTISGSLTGTSTVTTFVESATGVEAGGRTGLTALTAGIMFLLCMFIAPIVALIPAPATSSALIYVGIIMLMGLKNINLEDKFDVVPCMIMLITMPISGSIGHGIGLGLITYTVMKVFTGKAKDVSILCYVIAILFLIKFFVIV